MKDHKNEDNVKRILKDFSFMTYNRNMYEVFNDAMELFALSIANTSIMPLKQDKIFGDIWQEREQRYLNIAKKYSKREMNNFAKIFSLIVVELEKNPWQDLLGKIYMGLEISSKDKGQFFTPYNVCITMATITLDRKSIGKALKEKGYMSVADQSCGAGATLIAALEKCDNEFKKLNWQNHIYCVGQDISLLCCYMCYIQLSLHGVAGYVICTDSLMKPDIDSEKELNLVYFTPMWFSNTWTMRRFFHNQNILGQEGG